MEQQNTDGRVRPRKLTTEELIVQAKAWFGAMGATCIDGDGFTFDVGYMGITCVVLVDHNDAIQDDFSGFLKVIKTREQAKELLDAMAQHWRMQKGYQLR